MNSQGLGAPKTSQEAVWKHRFWNLQKLSWGRKPMKTQGFEALKKSQEVDNLWKHRSLEPPEPSMRLKTYENAGFWSPQDLPRNTKNVEHLWKNTWFVNVPKISHETESWWKIWFYSPQYLQTGRQLVNTDYFKLSKTSQEVEILWKHKVLEHPRPPRK